MQAPQSRAYFLFRSDEGQIDAATWWRGMVFLVAIYVAFTVLWHFIEPYADHDLNTTALFTLGIFAANVYRILYGFAIILILICYYNLSAKRWRDLGQPAALAGFLPVLAAVCGALHWLEPRTDRAIPHAVALVADGILVVVFIWNVIELGDLVPRRWRGG